MPLTLEETKSLIGALGLKIAESVLEQKAKGEEFKLRLEKINGEADKKPDDWHFKKDFADLLARANGAAGKQDFDAALGLLDDSEEMLQRPDAPPPPPPPVQQEEVVPPPPPDEPPPPPPKSQDQASVPSLEDITALSKARGVYTTTVSKARQQAGLLNVIPMANPSNLLAQIERAEERAKPDTVKGYQDATAELNGWEAEFKRQKEVAEKLNKAELQQWAKKPECQNRLAEAKSLYASLEKLPGLDDTLKKYADIIKAAEALVAKDDYAAGLTKLDELKKLPDEKACQKESKKALATLESSKTYKEGQAALTKLRGLAPETVVDAQAKPFDAVVRRVLGADGPKALNDLSPCVEQLKQAVASYTQFEADFKASKTKLTKALADFKAVGTRQEAGLLQTKLDAVISAGEARQFEEADRLSKQLLAELQNGTDSRSKLSDEWQKRQDEAKELAKKIGKLQLSKCLMVKERAMVLMSFVVPHEIKRLSEGGEWGLLVDGLNKAAKGIEELQTADQNFTKFQLKADAADVKVQPALSATEKAIKDFQAAVTKAGKAKGEAQFPAATDFEQELAIQKAAWEKKMASATSDQELNLQGTLDSLTKLQQAIAAANNDGGIKQRLDNQAQKKARELFEKDWLVLENEISKLQAFDNKAAIEARTEAGKLREKAASDYIAGVTALAQLNSRVGQAQKKASQDRAPKAAAVAKLGEEVLAAIEKLKKDTEKAKKFGPAFDALRAEQAELVLLGQSTNMDALAEAEAGFKALQSKLETLSKDSSGGGPTLDEAAGHFSDLEKEVKKANDVLSKNAPKALKGLMERLTGLKKSIAALLPEAAVKLIGEVRTHFGEVQAAAEKVLELRKKFKNLTPSVKKSWELFASRKVAPEYAKALKGRIEAAEELSKNADDLHRAMEQLDAIDKELKAAALDTPGVLAKEGALREKAKADKVAKTEWEHGKKIFESKRLHEAQAAIDASKGDKSLITELKNMISAAEEAADNGDHAQALKQLKLADKRVDEILKNPYGATIGSRNNLPKDAEVYKEAVQEFRAALGAFPEEVQKAVPDLPAPISQRMKSLLDSLSAKFEPAEFDPSVRLLTSTDLDDEARRAQRETALAKVRNRQTLLDNNPLLVSLVKNPIASGRVSVAMRRLDGSLTRLEANISRCCK